MFFSSLTAMLIAVMAFGVTANAVKANADDQNAQMTAVCEDCSEQAFTVTLEVRSDDETALTNQSTAKVIVSNDDTSEDGVKASQRTSRIVVRSKSSSHDDVESDAAEESEHKSVGKILITTPDGKVTEYDLNKDSLPNGVWSMDLQKLVTDGKPGVFRFSVNHDDKRQEETDYDIAPEELEELVKVNEAGERLMVGVHCVTADELLRLHLRSGAAGLVVIEVVEQSAAQAAGIQKNDVMLSAGDQPLSHPIDLLKAVKKAGETEMPIVLFRNGEKMTINVTPKLLKQPEPVVVTVGGELDVEDATSEPGELKRKKELETIIEERIGNASAGSFRLRQISPGIVINKSAGPEEIEKLVQQAMKAARSASQSQVESAEALRKQVAELREQVKMLSERLSTVESGKEEK